MGLFFKNTNNEQSQTNSYLDDQQSVFNTTGDAQPEKIVDSYDDYVYKPKDYSNVPKYHAADRKPVDIVINQDDFGYEDINPEVKTVNLQKRDLHEDLSEIVNNAPIDDSLKNQGISIYDENLGSQINGDEPIEIIDIDDDDKVVAEVTETGVNKSKKLSIFGVSDEPIQAKVHDIKEVPKEEKIDVIDPIPSQPAVEQPGLKVEDGTATSTSQEKENENKFCPNCGAPLSPMATTCFLCGKKL